MRIDSAATLPLLTLDLVAIRTALSLVAGQRVAATVTGVTADGQVVLDVGGRELAAQSSVPLRPGDRLTLEVAQTAPFVQLRVASTALPEEKAAAATLFQARAATGALPDATRPPGALPALAALAARLPPGPASVLANLLARAAGADADRPAEIAQQLERQVVDGGTRLESRLRAAFGQGGSPAGPALPPQVAGDHRIRLAEIGKLLDTLASQGAMERPLLEAARAEHRALTDAALADALGVAHRWLKDGELAVRLPIATDAGTTHAELRVARDGGRGGTSAGRERWSFAILVDLAPLGRVLARVELAGSAVSARILVERAETKRWMERELDTLAPALASAGFAHAQIGIDVDPLRIDSEFVRHDPPPPGGSLLSVRA